MDKKKLLSLAVTVILIILALAFPQFFGNADAPTPSQPSQTTAPTEAVKPTLPPATDPQTDPTQAPTTPPETQPVTPPTAAPAIDKDGVYTSKEDVALYIHTYGCLPGNFITKKQAESLGWTGGGLDHYANGKCIGGDRFGNYEGVLPKAPGRTYTECDIDTLHAKSRGAKRIVFSNDGLIYYTDDHYETFTLLYGEP